MSHILKKLLNKSGIYVSRYKSINDNIILDLKRKEEKYLQLIQLSFAIFQQNTNEKKGKQLLNNQELHLISDLEGTNEFEAFYIRRLLNEALTKQGDVCEFGVAQGKTSAFISYYLKETNKSFWLFDSFKGLPKPSSNDVLINDIFNLGSIESYEGTMSYEKNFLQGNLKKANANFDNIRIIDGFIEETYIRIPERICFAYIDFDFYNPIKITLDKIKTRLLDNCTMIVDDYGYFSSGAQKAVDEFIEENNQEFYLELPMNQYGNFCIIRKRNKK